jgi:hypothetical protein
MRDQTQNQVVATPCWFESGQGHHHIGVSKVHCRLTLPFTAGDLAQVKRGAVELLTPRMEQTAAEYDVLRSMMCAPLPGDESIYARVLAVRV